MDINAIVDRLEAMVGSASKVPFSNRVMVDKDTMLELIDQIRAALPSDMKEARQILERREQVINQSLIESKKIIAAAEQEAKNKVQQTEIVKQAERKVQEIALDTQRRAEAVVQEAKEQAARLHDEADVYARDVLHKLDNHLTLALSEVRGGIEVLERQDKAKASEVLEREGRTRA